MEMPEQVRQKVQFQLDEYHSDDITSEELVENIVAIVVEQTVVKHGGHNPRLLCSWCAQRMFGCTKKPENCGDSYQHSMFLQS